MTRKLLPIISVTKSMVEPLSRDIETGSTTIFEGLMVECENTLRRINVSDSDLYDERLRTLLIIWQRAFREFHFVLVPMASSRIYGHSQGCFGVLLSPGNRLQLL